MIDALDGLANADTFAVVAYDDQIWGVVPRANATERAKGQARTALRGLETRGSTNLFGGWEAGCMMLTQDEYRDMSLTNGAHGRVRRTILLSDGHANVGLTEPGLISGHVAQQRVRGIGTSTLGLGTGVDEGLLESMAEAGGGSSAFVEHARDLPAFFARELGEALATVATGAKLILTLPKGIRAVLLNAFPIERTGKTLTIALGDLPAGMTLQLVFSVTTRVKAEGILPALALTGEWQDVHADVRREHAIPIDSLMAVSPADFASMPLDDEAGAAAAEMIAADAKRKAIHHFRQGDRVAARASLSDAAMYAASAPMARAGLASEIRMMEELDPDSPEFQTQRRQIMNAEHRRSRGREL